MASKVLVSERCSVATEHPLASKAGVDVMRAGGNAFDAAVAASFTLSVVLPHLGGLGGDFFALFYSADTSEIACLNSSGWAPSGLTVEALRGSKFTEMPLFGRRSVTVPGMVGGVEELHRRFGRLEFGPLLDRAVRLAERGFPVSAGLARGFGSYRGSLSREALLAFGALGFGPQPGESLAQRQLAFTLRDIAEGGSGAFYKGDPAEEMAAEIGTDLPEVNRDDFAFTPEWVDPLSIEYRGREVFEVPPNSMGAAALMILKRIESENPPPPDSAERVMSVTQATREALAAKDEFIGDPRFAGFDLWGFVDSKLRPGGAPVRGGDTTYFAVADSRGNILSCIQSLFHPFGSRVYLKRSGFFLNNRASAFKFQGPNKLEPRKRPAHTLSALLLSNAPGEAPRLAMGTSGGERRPQLHALFVSNVVDYSMSLEEALSYPRFVWDGAETQAERGYKVGGGGAGVRVVDYPARQGVAQGIEISARGREAVCDVRGEGEPAGF